jgi:hypothetical protein
VYNEIVLIQNVILLNFGLIYNQFKGEIMKVLIQILIVILQLVAANLLGLALAVSLRLDNGWELVVFILGFSLGVWGVGALTARLRKTYQVRAQLIRLAATLVLSAVGVLIILVTPAIGFIRILYPLSGAFVGYYLHGWVLKR